MATDVMTIQRKCVGCHRHEVAVDNDLCGFCLEILRREQKLSGHQLLCALMMIAGVLFTFATIFLYSMTRNG